MERTGKPRQPQSFHMTFGSPGSSSAHRAAALGRNSVSELVARYQNILDYERAPSKQENFQIMVRNVLQKASGEKLAPPQGHVNNGSRSKSMENLTLYQFSSTAVKQRLQTSGDWRLPNTGKAAPTSQPTAFLFPALQTGPFRGSFRKSEMEPSTVTAIQPLTKGAKTRTELAFSSSQSNSRRQQWSVATPTEKDSARKEAKLSGKSTTLVSAEVPDTAYDSAPAKHYERTRSDLDITRHILLQGPRKPSSPSVKERSALYLSQTAAAAAHTGSLPQSNTTKEDTVHCLDSQKASKSMMKEVCSSCLQPVSSLDCVIANKVLLHHSCFCCKLCKRKLSLHNYTALHSAFYCKVHYKQLAEARAGSGEEKTDCEQDQLLHMGLGAEPGNRYNRVEKKIVQRERLQPRSFNSHPHLSMGPADGMKQQCSEFVTRNQLRTSWPPLKENSAEGARNPDKLGRNEGREAALKAHQAAGSRADGDMLRTRNGKSIGGTAVKKNLSLLPRVTFLKEEGPGFSWVKAGGRKGELGEGKKKLEFREVNVPRVPKRKQGNSVSEKVAMFQQSKPRQERESAPASSPFTLLPVKPPTHGSFISYSKALRAINWASTTAVPDGALRTAKLLLKDNKLSVTPVSEGSFNEGSTNLCIERAEPIPKILVNLPELTPSTNSSTHDQQHPEDAGSSPLATYVPGEAETHSIPNLVPGGGTGGYVSSQHTPETQVHPDEHEAVEGNETTHLTSESETSYTVADSPELGVLVPLHETVEQVNEDSKTDSQVFSGNLIPLSYEADVQGCREDLKSNGPEDEKVKKIQPESKMCYEFVEHPPGPLSQESKPKGRGISSAGQAGRKGDQTGSYLLEIESQNMCDFLVNIPQEDILIENLKLSTKDISGSMDRHLNAASTTGVSHEKPSSSEDTKLESKDQDDTLGQSILHLSSEPQDKKLEAFRSDELAGKAETHLAGNGNVDMKPQHENESLGAASALQSKGTGNGHARKDTLAKASSFGKNPFARLFTNENKGNTTKKPTKPQSALVTLFGYSSNKERHQKQNLIKPSPKLSEQTNNGNRQEPSQIRSSTSQSMQKANKEEEAQGAVTQIGTAEATPQDSLQHPEYHLEDGLSESFPHLGSTEVLGSNALLMTPSAGNLTNSRNEHETPSLEFHHQTDLNVQTAQQSDSHCLSSVSSRDSQEETPATKERRQPPMEPIAAADTSVSLTSEGKLYDTCLLKMENLAGLDDEDSKIKTEAFSALSHLGTSHKEVDHPLEDSGLLDSSTLLLSAGTSNSKSTSKNFPDLSGTDSQYPLDPDMQNSQAKDQLSSNLNSSELHTPWQRNDPQLLLKCSSLLLMEEDNLGILGMPRIQNSELLQQFDLDSQLQVDKDDPFGLGLDTRQPTADHLHAWGVSFQPPSTSTPCISEPLNDILDTLNTEATVALQQALITVEESVQAPDLP